MPKRGVSGSIRLGVVPIKGEHDMYVRQGISVGNLLLDTKNYRISKQESQKGARDAIIAEQGKKLLELAKDIVAKGLNPFDLPMVLDAADGLHNFIVVEGNRRLTTIQLMLNPDLAKDTPLYAGFAKLHKNSADAIPKVLDCVISPSRADALTWINRKHANGLAGAGTEPWTAMAKARADAEQGITRPDLDAINFVLSNPKIDTSLRDHLEGSAFNLTTLNRLISTSEMQKAFGISLASGALKGAAEHKWTQAALTDVVTIIATGKGLDGTKFTERDIDTPHKRETFMAAISVKHPGRKAATKPWTINGNPSAAAKTTTKAKGVRGAATTEDQENLIPKAFKLALPAGKMTDTFGELKILNIVKHRHAISVLFRVFFELSLEAYIARHKIALPTNKENKPVDKLKTKLSYVLKHVQTNKFMSEKELKPINAAVSDPNSLLAPDTLHAYVHSGLMNPDPLRLKVMWSNAQLFIERLWTSK